MKVKSDILLTELERMVKSHIARVQSYLDMNASTLNKKPSPESWSALECFEHLNRYGRFYLPEIENRIQSATPAKGTQFKSSWLGEYFAQSMLPKEKLNKMNTFKNMNPAGSNLSVSAVEEFIEQQNRMLRLLHNARQVDLKKVKTSISISKWIKLRLGDTFRVVIYHNLRHLEQAKRAIQ
ncbi:MAG: DinB family protein [Flavobacteriia bacterium]|nr:DinB family protein [Flavobacteriia bacterium]